MCTPLHALKSTSDQSFEEKNNLNTKSRLGFAQMHIWNMIEEIVFEKSKKNTISINNFVNNVPNILLSKS